MGYVKGEDGQLIDKVSNKNKETNVKEMSMKCQ